MTVTGSNLPAVGEYNRVVVLDAIRRAPGGVSRVEIAAATALSGQTVSNVCKVLLERHLIRRVGTRVNGRGKPALLLDLDPDGGFAIGVHIDPAVITYVLVDLTGGVRSRIVVDTPRVQDPDDVVRGMADAIGELMSSSGVDRERVLGVGIAAPGPIDAATGVVLDPPMLPLWHRVPLRDALGAAVGLPVLLEKDVTAATVAELWFASGAARRDFLFVYYGTGLATGIAAGGDVLRGVSSNAGDSGHITIDPDGPVCVCGRRGCVGDAAVPHGLVELAVRRGVISRSAVPERSDASASAAAFFELAGLARRGDPAAREIIAQAARWVAHASVLLVNLLDVREVVFGGPFWQHISEIFLDVLPGAARSDPAFVVRHAVDFTESAIAVDGTAIGAATLVLDNTLSPRPHALLLDAD